MRAALTILFLLCVFGSTSALAQATKAQKLHYQIISQTPLYDDPELAQYVDQIGQKLVRNSKTPDTKYGFYVLDDPGINAFTPGHGLIYINRGLINFMTSEGQLAAVLAHEIAHNTERHLSRRKSAQLWNWLAAAAGTILTGNRGVGQAIGLSNQARINSFGRELELEADQWGAEYMYQSNYDPQEMLGMLSVLKDQERFRDLQSLQDGGDATYHGVFSSHPRSDKRLQEVVRKAGALPPGESFRGREAIREMLDGVVYGANYTGNKVDGYERFVHKSLGVTFLYPEDWQQTIKGSKIILKDPAQTVQLKLEVEKTADKSMSSKQILKRKYPDDLSQVKPIIEIKNKQLAKDYGTTARRSQQRVAAITVGRNTFHFQGIARNNQLTQAQDDQFQDIIGSFRRASRQDLPPKELKVIYYKRLEPGETFASLAADKQLGTFTEETLRLINGYYPNGEAEPGTWMKLVRSRSLAEQEQELAEQGSQKTAG
ncbi:MAG: M48 family metalloprotease [Gammaproteobacteria bacterium]|nr:M48 family metalloprotease [Gammaproteobacteria bacterium]